MSIQFIKLSNGETIIADVLNMTDKRLTVLNPIEVSIKNVSDESKASMVAYQWLPLIEDENIIEINMFHIVAVSDASIRVKEYYVDVVDQYLYPEKHEQEEQQELDKYRQILKELQNAANTDMKVVH
jgi:hypothetical protein